LRIDSKITPNDALSAITKRRVAMIVMALVLCVPTLNKWGSLIRLNTGYGYLFTICSHMSSGISRVVHGWVTLGIACG
jgi:hypothetical protein